MLLKWPKPVGDESSLDSFCLSGFPFPSSFISFIPPWLEDSIGRSSLFQQPHGIMKLSIQFMLFFLLGLVASLALPKRQSPKQYTLVDSGKAVRADPCGHFR